MRNSLSKVNPPLRRNFSAPSIIGGNIDDVVRLKKYPGEESSAQPTRYVRALGINFLFEPKVILGEWKADQIYRNDIISSIKVVSTDFVEYHDIL